MKRSRRSKTRRKSKSKVRHKRYRSANTDYSQKHYSRIKTMLKKYKDLAERFIVSKRNPDELEMGFAETIARDRLEKLNEHTTESEMSQEFEDILIQFERASSAQTPPDVKDFLSSVTHDIPPQDYLTTPDISAPTPDTSAFNIDPTLQAELSRMW